MAATQGILSGPPFPRNPFCIPRSYVFTNTCFCLTKNSKRPSRFSSNWKSAHGCSRRLRPDHGRSKKLSTSCWNRR